MIYNFIKTHKCIIEVLDKSYREENTKGNVSGSRNWNVYNDNFDETINRIRSYYAMSIRESTDLFFARLYLKI